MRRKGYILTGIVVLLFAGGWRYQVLNQTYPDPEEYVAGQGEQMDLGVYSFELKNWKWEDGRYISQILPDYVIMAEEDGSTYPAEKEKVGLAEVEISKHIEDDSYLDLTNVAFEMGAWHNQWDNELFEALNGEDCLVLELEKGETCTVIFPVVMFEFQFNKADWEKIETRAVNIVLACYPEKYVLQGKKAE